MKHIYLLFLIILTTSCEPKHDSDKLIGQWTITSVQDITSGKLAPNEVNEGSSWIFESNDSIKIEFKNNPLWDSEDHGTYKLERDQLVLMMNSDTLTGKLEKLTDKELIFLLKDKLQFNLNKISASN